MNLYDQTLAAESEVSTYRHANIDDWIEAIEPVLAAAGEVGIGNDAVDEITVSEESLTIRTSYSVRCCSQTNDMHLPVSILKADNPVQAATQYRLSKELTETKAYLADAQRKLAEYTSKVAMLEAALSEIR